MQDPTLQCPILGHLRLAACLDVAYKDQPYRAQCRLEVGAERVVGGGEIHHRLLARSKQTLNADSTSSV